MDTIFFRRTCPRLMRTFLLQAIVILVISDQKQALGSITSFTVPPLIQQGEEATLECMYDDGMDNLLIFRWYSSADNVTSISDAILLQEYDKTLMSFSDRTGGRMSASLDSTGLSTLIIDTVDCKEDDKRYWCFVQVYGNTFENTKTTNICDCPDLTMTKGEKKENVIRNSIVELVSGERMNFTSIADGYKPDTPYLIKWTINKTEQPQSQGSPQPSGSDACPGLLDVSSKFTYTASIDDSKKMLCATANITSCSCPERFCVELLVSGSELSTSMACNCDNDDSKLCREKTCVCGQGYACIEGQCTGITAMGVKWATEGNFSEVSMDIKTQAAIQCNGMESALKKVSYNRGCCIRNFLSGSIIAMFQISIDTNINPTSVLDDIQTAIDNGEVTSLIVEASSLELSDINECAEDLAVCPDPDGIDPDICRDTATGYCCTDSVDDKCNGEYIGDPGKTCTCIEEKKSSSNKSLVIGLSVSSAVVVCGALGVVAAVILKNRSKNKVDNNSTPHTEDKKEETDKQEDDT